MSVFSKYKKQSITLGKESNVAILALAGRTIGEIGQLFQLDGGEFEWEEKPNPKNNSEMIRNLYINLKADHIPADLRGEYQLSVSKKFKWEDRFNEEWFMNCEVRNNFVAMVDADNNQVMGKDAQGNEIGLLQDGAEGRPLKRVLGVGNPSGLTKGATEKAFGGETEEQRIAREAKEAINA